MPFSVGSRVILLALGKKRGVVVATGRGGRYRVQVDNTTVSCREDDLAAPPEEDRRAKKAKSQATPARRGSDESAAPASRIDLHGMTVEEAIVRVVEEIDHALRRGADRVEVVHGKGSGRIRDALHRELAALPVVASFRLDPQNAGVTWVYL
jgi:DNA mismatch repair protein MutS2